VLKFLELFDSLLEVQYLVKAMLNLFLIFIFPSHLSSRGKPIGALAQVEGWLRHGQAHPYPYLHSD
jgi:hypothetical protein